MQIPAPELTSRGPRLRDARRLVDLIALWRPLRIHTDDAVGRGHPWRLSGGWDEGQRRWELRLDPATVNGQEVLAPAQPIEELPERALERIRAVGGADLPETARAWLTERPSIGVSTFRAVGTDAFSLDGSAEQIPEYFLDRGVVPPAEVSTAGQQLTIVQGDTGVQGQRRRLLRGADIVLNVPRPVARLSVGPGNRPQVALSLPDDAAPFLTVQSARYEPEAEAGSIQEEFARAAVDEGLDRLLIGRLWLLSPRGTVPGSDPTPAWTAYGENFVFHNLDHDVDVDLDVIEPVDLGFSIPLAGGVAQLTIAGLTAELEANDALASAYLSVGKVRGSYRSV